MGRLGFTNIQAAVNYGGLRTALSANASSDIVIEKSDKTIHINADGTFEQTNDIMISLVT